ncbi:MFS transporter [Aeribacillus pallidus]|uniref:MFS transporter n=1 Tax=Aeribacillus pallidus TaxID=33936 RepID=UPI0018DEEFEF|nr:MFS transporter [Aeribacillus pallidus]
MLEKKGTRVIVPIAVIAFSLVTFFLGTVSSAALLILLRLLLGLSEGFVPVSMATTINNWFPAKEKATATGVYIASTQIAPIFVPIVATEIAVSFGWRYVFYWFAIPGFVIAIIW